MTLATYLLCGRTLRTGISDLRAMSGKHPGRSGRVLLTYALRGVTALEEEWGYTYTHNKWATPVRGVRQLDIIKDLLTTATTAMTA